MCVSVCVSVCVCVCVCDTTHYKMSGLYSTELHLAPLTSKAIVFKNKNKIIISFMKEKGCTTIRP